MTLATDPPPDDVDVCAACGRDLWAFGPPAQEGDVWICGDCDAARNHDVLDV